MAEEQTKSRADRLHEVLKKHAPKAVEYHKKHKGWPPSGGSDEDPAAVVTQLSAKLQRDDKLAADKADRAAADSLRSRQQAPYVVQTLRDGKTRILVTKDDGTQIAGTGATVEEAMAALEGGAR